MRQQKKNKNKVYPPIKAQYVTFLDVTILFNMMIFVDFKGVGMASSRPTAVLIWCVLTIYKT